LMQNAGLTKGAFYGHFESRDAMIAEATRRAMQKGQSKLDPLFSRKKKPSLDDGVDAWLDPAHVQDPTSGCGICTLAGEARYDGPQVRQVIAEQPKRNVEQIAQTIGADETATARATAILALECRATSTSPQVGEVLANTIGRSVPLASDSGAQAGRAIALPERLDVGCSLAGDRIRFLYAFLEGLQRTSNTL
jgi:AcrR family transcriptional regulator